MCTVQSSKHSCALSGSHILGLLVWTGGQWLQSHVELKTSQADCHCGHPTSVMSLPSALINLTVSVCVLAFVRACVRSCMRSCVRACVHACVCVWPACCFEMTEHDAPESSNMRVLQLLSVPCVCTTLFVFLQVSEGTICACVFVCSVHIVMRALTDRYPLFVWSGYPLVHFPKCGSL